MRRRAKRGSIGMTQQWNQARNSRSITILIHQYRQKSLLTGFIKLVSLLQLQYFLNGIGNQSIQSSQYYNKISHAWRVRRKKYFWRPPSSFSSIAEVIELNLRSDPGTLRSKIGLLTMQKSSKLTYLNLNSCIILRNFKMIFEMQILVFSSTDEFSVLYFNN